MIRKTILKMSVIAALVVFAIGIIGYSKTVRFHIESAGRPNPLNRGPDDESGWLSLRSADGRILLEYHHEHGRSEFNPIGLCAYGRTANLPKNSAIDSNTFIEKIRRFRDASPNTAGAIGIKTWWPQVPGVSAFRYRRFGIEVVRSLPLIPDEWIHLSIPFWQPTAALLAYPIFMLATRPIRHRWRRKRGICVRCGYNLTGNISGVCPECGTPA